MVALKGKLAVRIFAPISRPFRRRLTSLAVTLAVALMASTLSAEEVKVFDLRIEGRAVVGDTDTINVQDDGQVVLRWTTDERVGLHLHGYNLTLELKPGETGTMSFEAFATGRYPITSHGFGDGSDGHSKGALIYLEVHPR
jgi:ferric-dicitrate binding protein FerR (iron transport regulator)